MSSPPRITIAGIGAVSPAGWGVAPLRELMEVRAPLARQTLTRPGPDSARTLSVLRVPKAPVPAPFPAHPRLRRSSPISQFAAAAALEALRSADTDSLPDNSPNARTGIIFTLLNGCVNYSNRFYTEVLRDPPTASPILFPETVFNAPASHLATLLGSTAPAFTLIGDTAQFIPGLELAAQWLLDGVVDRCLVVGAEEIDPLTAEALHLLSPGIPASEGAGAILLERDGPGPLLQQIAGPIPIPGPPSRQNRAAAAARLRQEIDALPDHTLLIDDLAQPLCASSHSRIPPTDLPTRQAWEDWTGPRLSPRRLLGESLGASTALQCVLAVQSLLSGKHPAVLTIATGGDQQASALLLTL